MSLTISRFKKIIITSTILTTYLGGVFGQTGEALVNNISSTDIGQVAIEQTIQQKNSNNFLSTLFSIPTTYADNGTDIYSKLKDIKGSTFENVIVKAYQKGIISGYSDGTFRPNASVSFVESLKIIISAGPQGPQIVNYKTNQNQKWTEPYKLMYNSLYKTNERFFNDNDKVTRDFSVYLMLRQIGVTFTQKDYAKIPHNFTDVNSNSKFAPYLAFANYVGISNGYADGTFGVDKTISRGELTKMAFRTLIDNKDLILQKYKTLMGIGETSSTQINQQIDQGTNGTKSTYNSQGQETGFTQTNKVNQGTSGIKNTYNSQGQNQGQETGFTQTNKVNQGTNGELYTYNNQGQKTGFTQVKFIPKTYEELASVLNEKGVIEKSNYPLRKNGSIPTPYHYISGPADWGFSLAFYKYISESNDLTLPLYLIPDISYQGGLGEPEVWKLQGLDYDTRNLPPIDIAKYPSLKTLVDKAMEFDKSDRDMFTFSSSAATQYIKDNNFEEKLAKDVYQLLIDHGINKEDYILKGNIITYNGGGGLFSTYITARGLAKKLYKNYRDTYSIREYGKLKNSFSRYTPGQGINLIIDLYLNKLSGYRMTSDNVSPHGD